MTHRYLLLGLGLSAFFALGCNTIAGLDDLDKASGGAGKNRFTGGFVAGAAEGTAGSIHLRGVLSWNGAAHGESADGAMTLTGVLQ